MATRYFYTEEEKQQLRELYPIKGAHICAELMGKSVSSIKSMCQKLKVKLLPETWSRIAKKSKEKTNDKFQVNPDVFLNITQPEAAYILGLIWGDGSLYGKYQINLGCVKEDAEYFYTQFLKTGKWKIYQRIHEKWRDSSVIWTSNEFIMKKLLECDYKSKSFMSADKILSHIPIELHRFFFIGLTDADGSFYYNRKTGHTNQFTLYSGYEQDWSYMEELYKKLNITYKVSRILHKKSKSSMIRITGYTNIQKYGEFLYASYKDDLIGLPRKYKVYSEIIDRNKHV